MIYGIDLGTTQSCVARIHPRFNFPDALVSGEGQPTTPSVVYLDENNTPSVGDTAKAWFESRPERTVMCIKRRMSERDYRRQIGDLTLDPVDVSALILQKLVDDANRKLHDEEGRPPIKRVVITVPAYFGNLARERTKKAGERAGLKVVELLSEPEAAALTYFSNNMKKMENKIILVYDLGGGTFDAGIVKVREERIETLGFGGDPNLGGFDWDKTLAEMALFNIGLAVDIPDDPANFTGEIGALLLKAEACKKNLSSSQSFNFSFFYQNELRNMAIARDDFERCTVDLLDRTFIQIKEAARKADEREDKPRDEPRILNSDGSIRVDEVILVGGASRMPMVQNMIRNKLRKEPRIADPDLAVAKGAAIYAGILNEKPVAGIREVKSRVPYSYGLGIETINKDTGATMVFISNLIKTNEPKIIDNRLFPDNFVTSRANKEVTIEIYENTSDADQIERGNRKPIKSGTIKFGEEVPRNTDIALSLSRDANGIVTLHASVKGKGECTITFETR